MALRLGGDTLKKSKFKLLFASVFSALSLLGDRVGAARNDIRDKQKQSLESVNHDTKDKIDLGLLYVLSKYIASFGGGGEIGNELAGYLKSKGKISDKALLFLGNHSFVRSKIIDSYCKKVEDFIRSITSVVSDKTKFEKISSFFDYAYNYLSNKDHPLFYYTFDDKDGKINTLRGISNQNFKSIEGDLKSLIKFSLRDSNLFCLSRRKFETYIQFKCFNSDGCSFRYTKYVKGKNQIKMGPDEPYEDISKPEIVYSPTGLYWGLNNKLISFESENCKVTIYADYIYLILGLDSSEDLPYDIRDVILCKTAEKFGNIKIENWRK